MSDKDLRKRLAIYNYCRCVLGISNMITEVESKKIHNRIMKWRDKNKINISLEQLDSVELIYDDEKK